jgi:methylmalonyl-CoA mutase cobalamin-binding subunit
MLTYCTFISAYTATFICKSQNATAAAIQERVTAVLRSIPKEAFADSFQKLYEPCQPCVVKDCDYFEGQ